MKFSKGDILEALGIESERTGFTMLLAGFGVGCLVGAAVAVLVAPKSGPELRENLMDRGRDLVKRGKDQIIGKADEMNKPSQSPTY